METRLGRPRKGEERKKEPIIYRAGDEYREYMPVPENFTLRAKAKYDKRYRCTYREIEMMRLVAAGYTAKEIGKLGDLSERTVEGMIIRLQARFVARNKTELAVKMVREGYI